MDKTIVVKVDGAFSTRSTRSSFADPEVPCARETNAFKGKVGENVRIRECRPLSKTKSWEVLSSGEDLKRTEFKRSRR